MIVLNGLILIGFVCGVFPSESPKDEKKSELTTKKDERFFTSVDILMNSLGTELTQLPEKSRMQFLSCMTSDMAVERVAECLRKAKRSGKLVNTRKAMTLKARKHIRRRTSTRSHQKKHVEKQRSAYKKHLDSMRKKLQRFGSSNVSSAEMNGHNSREEETTSLTESLQKTMNSIGQTVENLSENVILGETEEVTTQSSTTTTTSSTSSTTTTRPTTTYPKAVYKVRSVASITDLTVPKKKNEKSAVSSMSDLILSFLRPKGNETVDGGSIVDEYSQFAQKSKKTARPTNAGVKFFDVELGKEEDTSRLNGGDLPLTRETLHLINGLAPNMTSAEEREIKLLSPRIGSLMPKKTKAKGLLSPSIFALYEDNEEEQIMSIPKVLRDLGLQEADKRKVMEVALEIAGARKIMEKKREQTTKEFRI